MNGITKKSRLGQLLCKHKNKGWYTKNSMFQSLSGERQYQVCTDCGKVVSERFLEYEGSGYK